MLNPNGSIFVNDGIADRSKFLIILLVKCEHEDRQEEDRKWENNCKKYYKII